MKKKILIIVCILILIILLIPIKTKYKDGGTVVYNSVLYKITDAGGFATTANGDIGYEEGIVIEIFGFKVFDNVKVVGVK